MTGIGNNYKNGLCWKFKGYNFDLADRVLIMGIINLSPDSFYRGSHYDAPEAIEQALIMEADGADIIDIGARSTRPGSEEIPLDIELKRIQTVLPRIIESLKIPISVDTYKSEIARYSLDIGADIINDISALRFDQKMVNVVKDNNCGIVIMHIKGRPKDMQKNPVYDNLLGEIHDHLGERIDFLRKNDIDDERVAIDPGLGFGKQLKHNYQLINRLEVFYDLNRPILVGISRKSFTGAPLNIPPEERLPASIALETLAVMNGARVLRVHDVREAKQAVSIIQEYTRCQS